MKKQYLEPSLRVLRITGSDIIATSDDPAARLRWADTDADLNREVL